MPLSGPPAGADYDALPALNLQLLDPAGCQLTIAAASAGTADVAGALPLVVPAGSHGHSHSEAGAAVVVGAPSELAKQLQALAAGVLSGLVGRGGGGGWRGDLACGLWGVGGGLYIKRVGWVGERSECGCLLLQQCASGVSQHSQHAT